MTKSPPSACRFCGAGNHIHVAHFDARPEGETDFSIEDYARDLWQCQACGHVVNLHDHQSHEIYSGDYVDSTYGGRMEATFRRIMAFSPEKSDNRQRVQRIVRFAESFDLPGRSALDVGSGLGVFPAALKETGWDCLALDPDPRAAEHIRETAQVSSLAGDFFELEPSKEQARRFDLVTFNKVLEHVLEPIEMLRRSRLWLKQGGIIYIELPDGENALIDAGPGREEFFIEHYDAYSAASITLLIRQSGFRCLRIERLIEPSGKYTLAAFAASE
jgi:2-polyprenyl-3-methyl-5-hydroxy-6-metoxy-1,4-benzoquinol methylase